MRWVEAPFMLVDWVVDVEGVAVCIVLLRCDIQLPSGTGLRIGFGGD